MQRETNNTRASWSATLVNYGSPVHAHRAPTELKENRPPHVITKTPGTSSPFKITASELCAIDESSAGSQELHNKQKVSKFTADSLKLLDHNTKTVASMESTPARGHTYRTSQDVETAMQLPLSATGELNDCFNKLLLNSSPVWYTVASFQSGVLWQARTPVGLRTPVLSTPVRTFHGQTLMSDNSSMSTNSETNILQLSSMKEELSSMKEKLEARDTETEQLEEINGGLVTSNSKLAGLQAENTTLSEQMENVQRQQDSTVEENNALKIVWQIREDECKHSNNLKVQLLDLHLKPDSMRDAVESVTDQRSEDQGKLSSALQGQAHLEGSLQKMDIEAMRLVEKVKKLELKLEELRQETDAKEKEMKSLKAQLNEMCLSGVDVSDCLQKHKEDLERWLPEADHSNGVSAEKFNEVTKPGCSTIKHNRKNNPELEKRRIHHCTFPGCNTASTSSYNLKIHQRIHTGEKPYKCNIQTCEQSFSRIEELNRHKRKHTGAKPFKCQACDRDFARSDKLNTHKKQHEPKNK